MSASLRNDSIGYCLSPSQLDQLYHYDLMLGHVLMDLPLRKCDAVPASLSKQPGMDPVEFQNLKEEVRKMWIFASTNFTCKKTEHEWGLFFGPEIEQNGKLLTLNNPGIMGWLARVPSVEECPTGHRYLRSLCCRDSEDNIYLGGPISIANFDEVDRVECKRCISNIEPRRNKLAVTRVRGRRLVAGMEVLWSYNLGATKKANPNLSPQNEWQLDICCSELEKPQTVERIQVTSLPEANDSAGPVPKKRKVGGYMPQKIHKCVTSFKPCTYCGINVPSNIKRHWALTHAKDLCKEMGVDNDKMNPVSPQLFIQHLDKVNHVFNSLNNHNYKVVPACNFFKITGNPLLELNASSDEKNSTYEKFLSEGRTAFNKYNVLYLKGISVPKSYEDLLLPEKSTNFSAVNWNDTPPATNNFSLELYPLSKIEAKDHAVDVQNSLSNVVLGWMT